MRRAARIVLAPDDWALLHRWITDRRAPARIRRRARIVLGSAMGRSNREIARTLDLDPATVSFWRKRVARDGLVAGLRDAPRPGRRRTHTAATSERILHATLNVPPPVGARWTTRSLALFLGVNHMQVHRTWKAGGIRQAPPSIPEVTSPGPSERPGLELSATRTVDGPQVTTPKEIRPPERGPGN